MFLLVAFSDSLLFCQAHGIHQAQCERLMLTPQRAMALLFALLISTELFQALTRWVSRCVWGESECEQRSNMHKLVDVAVAFVLSISCPEFGAPSQSDALALARTVVLFLIYLMTSQFKHDPSLWAGFTFTIFDVPSAFFLNLAKAITLPGVYVVRTVLHVRCMLYTACLSALFFLLAVHHLPASDTPHSPDPLPLSVSKGVPISVLCEMYQVHLAVSVLCALLVAMEDYYLLSTNPIVSPQNPITCRHCLQPSSMCTSRLECAPRCRKATISIEPVVQCCGAAYDKCKTYIRTTFQRNPAVVVHMPVPTPDLPQQAENAQPAKPAQGLPPLAPPLPPLRDDHPLEKYEAKEKESAASAPACLPGIFMISSLGSSHILSNDHGYFSCYPLSVSFASASTPLFR